MTARCAAALIVFSSVAFSPVAAADWPTWRHDARRSGASPQILSAKLHLHWVRELPALKTAWPDQAKMQFDAAYEPIVIGKTLFVGSSRWDCVTAYDTASGAEKWRFFADGPVRFAPVAWEGRLYFSADDGFLYCLDAATGTLLWKLRGGPGDRRILGNERLISTWPARGAPVIADGNVYFAASIWPFMGIFIHAVDARTGKTVWTNDGDGFTYMKQPHNAEAFAGVAPQGPLTVLGDKLLIPGGRSIPALYDRSTGQMVRYQLAENGKKGGGFEVSALGKYFFNGGAAFDLASEKYLGEIGKPLAFTDNIVFAYNKSGLVALEAAAAEVRETETIDNKGKKTKVTRWTMPTIAALKVPPLETLIVAGSRVYAGAGNKILGFDFDLTARTLTPSWQTEVEGNVARLIAADDRLFAVTLEGQILCFAEPPAKTVRHPHLQLKVDTQDGWSSRLKEILDTSGQREGYCIAWGIASGNLVAELARQTKFHTIVVDPDEKKVEAFRRKMVAEDLYGTKISVHVGDPGSCKLPPYLASLMVCEDPAAAGIEANKAFLEQAYPLLRPYGGAACFLSPHGSKLAEIASQTQLAGAETKISGNVAMLARKGALPGAGNWTHEHADASNTRVSKDKLVKAPLGILWFGGPSHDEILPRHGHGPQPQVIDGRLIIEGVDVMRAVDIYTGRLLWQTRLPGVGSFYNNLAHQPGANSSGSNFVSTSDGVYVVHGFRCVKLDLADGKIIAEFKLPAGEKGKASRWGYLNVEGDYLIGGADPILDPKLLPKPPKDPSEGDDKEGGVTDTITKLLKTAKNFNDNMSASMQLVVMNRHTGAVLWKVSAKHGFRHNGTCIGGGRLYTIDRLSGEQLAKLKRRGEEPASPFRIFAFDLKTGKEIWSTSASAPGKAQGDENTDWGHAVFGTWLSYSAKHDVLVEAGRVARDSLTDEPKGMRAYDAATGKVLWFEKSHTGPAMIHGDTILQGQGACDLLTGALKMRPDPLTGEMVPWKWIRTYGCNTPAASEHLLTFRSGAAGFFDLCHDGGTGNFGGFRSSCTNNLIVAGGILTVPDYTRTCTCLYQNQTSVALVPMPELEMWTYFGTKEVKGQIKRLGLNFGASGDRKADDGTLWLEHPGIAGVSPTVKVTTTPAKLSYYRRFSTQVQGPMSWVTASGVKGLSDLTIDLGGKGAYTVRLYFAEPEPMQPGQRVFSVYLQGKEVRANFDLAKEAGGPNRSLMMSFPGIIVDGELSLRLAPHPSATLPETILSGIEVIAE